MTKRSELDSIIVKLTPDPDVRDHPVPFEHRVKAVLKILGRQYGMRASWPRNDEVPELVPDALEVPVEWGPFGPDDLPRENVVQNSVDENNLAR